MASEIYRGTITWNTIKLYANGSKKRFEGFIVIKDTNSNETSYKMVSFRSQVIIQGETLGEKGMSGKSCVAHGEFKENTWNGETTWQFMCDKLILDGMEELADQAEKAATPLPAVPAGTLPSNPMQPMQPIIGVAPIAAAMPPPIIGVAPIAATMPPPMEQVPQTPIPQITPIDVQTGPIYYDNSNDIILEKK